MAWSNSGTTCASIRDLVKCDICLQQLNDPRLLTCGHTFCSQCLQIQLDQTGAHARFRMMTMACAYCRKSTRLTTHGITDLPVNCLANRILHLLAMDNAACASVDSRLDDISPYDLSESDVAPTSVEHEGSAALATCRSSVYTTIGSWLTCGVCSRHCSDPRVLTCGHMYCMQCIERLNATSFNKKQVSCSQCHKMVRVLHSNGGSLADLPRNFIADNMHHILVVEGHLAERRPPHQSRSYPQSDTVAPAAAGVASSDTGASRVTMNNSDMAEVTLSVHKVINVGLRCGCCGAEVRSAAGGKRLNPCGHWCCVRCQSWRRACKECARSKRT